MVANKMNITNNYNDQILILLKKGQKIQAIKYLHDASGAGIPECKTYIETLSIRYGIPEPGRKKRQ
jgi:ribosomal protein L7/L12